MIGNRSALGPGHGRVEINWHDVYPFVNRLKDQYRTRKKLYSIFHYSMGTNQRANEIDIRSK